METDEQLIEKGYLMDVCIDTQEELGDLCQKKYVPSNDFEQGLYTILMNIGIL